MELVDLSNGLDPSSFLGITLILFGILFSIGCFYIMYNLSNDSIFDQRRKAAIEKERADKIAKLYPKQN